MSDHEEHLHLAEARGEEEARDSHDAEYVHQHVGEEVEEDEDGL